MKRINILYGYDARAMDFKDEEIYEADDAVEAVNRFLIEFPNERHFQVHISQSK